MHSVTRPPPLAVPLTAPELLPPSQAQIQAHVEALLLAQATYRPVPRASQWGDRITLDTLATCEGQIIPASIGQGMQLLLQPGGEAWWEQLTGLKAGEKRTLNLPLPADHPHVPWRGQNAHYQLHVRRIEAVSLPTPEAAITQAYGPGEEGQRQLLDTLQQQNERSWRQYIRLQVGQTLTEHSQIDYPSEWLDQQLSQSWEQTDGPLLKARKMLPQELEAARQGFIHYPPLRAAADASLRMALVLREVAQQAGLILDKAQFEAQLQPLAQALQAPLPRVLKRLQSEQALVPIADQILLEQALSHVMAQATLHYQDQTYALR
jgi:trigger factor